MTSIVRAPRSRASLASARAPWSRARRPQEVAAALETTQSIAVRSGGHCFAGRSSTTGTLIDVGPMDTVTVAGELATIGAGARLGAVYDALAAHGRTVVAGCGPTVGISGLAARRRDRDPRPPARAHERPARVRAGGARRRAHRRVRCRAPPRPVLGAARRRRRALRRADAAHAADASRGDDDRVRPDAAARAGAERDRAVAAVGTVRARGAGRQPARDRRRGAHLRRLPRLPRRGGRPARALRRPRADRGARVPRRQAVARRQRPG